MRSNSKPSLLKIMREQAREKSRKLRNADDQETGETLSSTSIEETCVNRVGTTNHSLSQHNEKGPDETCPSRGVIFTQNILGFSGKDKGLESLMDPLVEIMISNGIMIYCVQETWILGNSSTMVRDHMVVMHNMNEKEPGSKGRVKGG